MVYVRQQAGGKGKGDGSGGIGCQWWLAAANIGLVRRGETIVLRVGGSLLLRLSSRPPSGPKWGKIDRSQSLF